MERDFCPFLGLRCHVNGQETESETSALPPGQGWLGSAGMACGRHARCHDVAAHLCRLEIGERKGGQHFSVCVDAMRAGQVVLP